jgi:hypothetical protein
MRRARLRLESASIRIVSVCSGGGAPAFRSPGQNTDDLGTYARVCVCVCVCVRAHCIRVVLREVLALRYNANFLRALRSPTTETMRAKNFFFRLPARHSPLYTFTLRHHGERLQTNIYRPPPATRRRRFYIFVSAWVMLFICNGSYVTSSRSSKNMYVIP